MTTAILAAVTVCAALCGAAIASVAALVEDALYLRKLRATLRDLERR